MELFVSDSWEQRSFSHGSVCGWKKDEVQWVALERASRHAQSLHKSPLSQTRGTCLPQVHLENIENVQCVCGCAVNGAMLSTGAYVGCSSPFLRPLNLQVDIPRSLTRGRCDTRPTVTFPAAQHCRCPLAGTHFPSCWGQDAELAGVAGCIPSQCAFDQSPIPVLTGLNIEKRRLCNQRRCH